jgi:phytoene desaturase
MSSTTPGRAVVIGGGIAGLATAALLAARGHDVDLFEKNDDLGGRVGSLTREGYRFDTGPSWYLMPEVFDHFFRLLGTSAADELDLVSLDPSYRVFFEGGHPPVDVHGDRARNQNLFESIEAGAGRALGAYLDSAGEVYDLALRRFLYATFARPQALMHREILRSGPRLAPLLTRSLRRHVAHQFTDHRLQQVLGYPAVFLGSAPERTPGLYHLMSHLDLDGPVLYPQGGFVTLIDAIAGLARRHGARLHTGTPVTRILTRNASTPGRRRHAQACGVEVEEGGQKHSVEADLVVGAADLHHIEQALLPTHLRTHPESAWRRRTPGPGAVLALLGVRGPLPQLPHHSLFFTRDWDRNFSDIFGPAARVPEPASIYVCKPSATDPSTAPPGCENLFVLIPVPADVSIGSGGPDGHGDPRVERAVDAAIAQISTWAGIRDLSDRVEVRESIGPQDFAQRFNAWKGGALGLEHSLRQSAFLRPTNVSRRVDGLLYAGASTTPGVGLPMCLISAQLVVKRITGDHSPGPLPIPQEA